MAKQYAVQQKVLAYIQAYQKTRKQNPSIMEITKALKFKYRGSAYAAIEGLENKGFLLGFITRKNGDAHRKRIKDFILKYRKDHRHDPPALFISSELGINYKTVYYYLDGLRLYGQLTDYKPVRNKPTRKLLSVHQWMQDFENRIGRPPSIEEAAHELRLHPNSIKRWIKKILDWQEKLESIKIPKKTNH